MSHSMKKRSGGLRITGIVFRALELIAKIGTLVSLAVVSFAIWEGGSVSAFPFEHPAFLTLGIFAVIWAFLAIFEDVITNWIDGRMAQNDFHGKSEYQIKQMVGRFVSELKSGKHGEIEFAGKTKF